MDPKDALHRLDRAPWLKTAEPFFVALGGENGKTRAVGGIVRDTLLGIARSATDLDLATQLLPETVIDLARRAGLAAYPTGLDHGTITLVAGDAKAEVTTLRRDVETFGRHASVQFGTDWTADAERRDFTMNALYCDAGGELFDPLGGLED
ncbi:MAG TPA: CCA tRNA nucleotidyltransferase, partial [Tianweitania sediminis]|nr:CCA tRNA nucleotidyltransferase [Tianweitania sediminis]